MWTGNADKGVQMVLKQTFNAGNYVWVGGVPHRHGGMITVAWNPLTKDVEHNVEYKSLMIVS